MHCHIHAHPRALTRMRVDHRFATPKELEFRCGVMDLKFVYLPTTLPQFFPFYSAQCHPTTRARLKHHNLFRSDYVKPLLTGYLTRISGAFTTSKTPCRVRKKKKKVFFGPLSFFFQVRPKIH